MQVGVMVTSNNHRHWDRTLAGCYDEQPITPDLDFHRETVKLGDTVEAPGIDAAPDATDAIGGASG
jgi:hypothetical protein